MSRNNRRLKIYAKHLPECFIKLTNYRCSIDVPSSAEIETIMTACIDKRKMLADLEIACNCFVQKAHIE